MSSAFLHGFGIGVLVAAPIGPMALLAIRRTLERGYPSGVASGLGIATADAFYAAAAAFGLAALSGYLVGHARTVELVGALVIVALGLWSLLARGEAQDRPAPERAGLAGAYASCLGLTLANPPTILTFAALFASIGGGRSGWAAAALLTAGVFAGSAAWWFVLTGAAARLRSRLSGAWRRRLTMAAGLAMVLLGLALGARSIAG